MVPVSAAPPRAQMDFIDRDRFLERVGAGPPLHPLLVVPRELRKVGDDRRGTGRQLGRKSVGIALVDDFVVLPADAELVLLAGTEAGNEDLPYAAGGVQLERVAAAVPVVEVADDAHGPGVRRPDGEVDPLHAVDRPHLGPELLVAAEQLALAE